MNIYNEEAMRKILRQIMLTARGELLPDQIQEWSGSLISKLAAFPQMIRAQNIMCFLSIKNEVDLRPFIYEAQQDGKKILIPRVETKNLMVAAEYQPSKTTRGPFDITEPVGESFDPQQIDVVLVPGLVFDYNGYRLGYGGGYYDRFLPLLRPDAFICGVCYDFQIVETVFPHAEDIAVDWIVTEKSEVVVNWEQF